MRAMSVRAIAPAIRLEVVAAKRGVAQWPSPVRIWTQRDASVASVAGVHRFALQHRSCASSGLPGPVGPNPPAAPTAAELVRRLLEPSRVHDVFNPRLGVVEGSSPAWVSDAGRVLSEADFHTLNSLCTEINAAWRAEVSVVVLEALPDDVQPSAFAAALLNYWGVGDARLHTGLVILLLHKQRRLEMRVGFGLGRALSQRKLMAIQEASMVPHFRVGDIASAFCQGVRAIHDELEAHGPAHWRCGDSNASSASENCNRHGFGGGQTSIDEFRREPPTE